MECELDQCEPSNLLYDLQGAGLKTFSHKYNMCSVSTILALVYFIEISKNYRKIEILVKNRNLSRKIEILVNNRNV